MEVSGSGIEICGVETKIQVWEWKFTGNGLGMEVCDLGTEKYGLRLGMSAVLYKPCSTLSASCTIRQWTDRDVVLHI